MSIRIPSWIPLCAFFASLSVSTAGTAQQSPAPSSRNGQPTQGPLTPPDLALRVGSDAQNAATLSSNVYNIQVPNTGKIISGVDAAALAGAPPGFTIVSAINDPVSGYVGVAYQNNLTGQITITSRGTAQLSDVESWPALGAQTTQTVGIDGSATKNAFGQQLDQAALFTDSVTSQYGTYDTVLAGHSLGGAMCQMESARTGVTCYADNSPGMSDLIKRTYGDDAPTAQIHTQCSSGDGACEVGTQPGTVDYFQVGNSDPSNPLPASLNVLGQHSIDNLSDTINSSAQPIKSCDENGACQPGSGSAGKVAGPQSESGDSPQTAGSNVPTPIPSPQPGPQPQDSSQPLDPQESIANGNQGDDAAAIAAVNSVSATAPNVAPDAIPGNNVTPAVPAAASLVPPTFGPSAVPPLQDTNKNANAQGGGSSTSGWGLIYDCQKVYKPTAAAQAACEQHNEWAEWLEKQAAK